MSTGAIIMMVTTQSVFVIVTGYFFFKVLTTKPSSEPDSFSDNDVEEN
jgi:hypothetical protein